MCNHTDMQDKYCGQGYDIHPIQSQYKGNHKRGAPPQTCNTGAAPPGPPATLGVCSSRAPRETRGLSPPESLHSGGLRSPDPLHTRGLRPSDCLHNGRLRPLNPCETDGLRPVDHLVICSINELPGNSCTEIHPLQ